MKKSLYLLSVIHPRFDNSIEKPIYEKIDGETIGCWIERIGIYDSIKKAELSMKDYSNNQKQLIEKWDNYIEVFGYVIDEMYLNDKLDKYGNVEQFESRRTYLNDCSLNCFSDLDWRCKKKFNGRSIPHCNVKKDDFAYVWSGNSIFPVYVQEVPFTKDEWKINFKKGVCGDVTDDSGIVYTLDHGHMHPFSPNVFPLSALPYAKISKKNLSKMKSSADKNII